jgi:Kdo2-lipid IVA lauroyltransferase/acyltransferase
VIQRLFQVLKTWPLPALHRLGGALGWVVYALSPTYRSRLRAHAAQAGLNRHQRRAAVAEAGRMVAELPRLWLRPAGEPVSPPLQWQGAELVDAALDQGRGLLLLTPHLGCFEVCAQAYAERWGHLAPMTALYRPSRSEGLRRVMETARARPGLLTAPASLAGVRQMIRALRRGEVVGLLPDQVPPLGMGVWAPFFDTPAYTMTLAARLAEQTGAQLLLIVGERLADAAGWRVHLLPLPQPLPVRDEDSAAGQDAAREARHQEACARSINLAMESVIRQWPQQYLWGYHRYKQPRRRSDATRLPGARDLGE